MEKIKKYEKYKDSGIEWIGEIPEHWEVRNLQIIAAKERYSFTGGPFGSDLKANEYTQTGVRIIQLQNIGVGEFLDDYKIYTSEEKADDLFSCNIFPNEVIVAKMADPVARACLMPDYDERYLMASDGIRIKVSDEVANSKYVVYSMNSPYFKAQAEINSEGTTRLRIGLNALKKLKVILPPVQEQLIIATFLDRKTAEIDRITANKQKLITFYEEEKQAIINQAVTKGLDPTVKLKESGVEWLGEIPEHWEVKRLKHLTSIISKGTTPSTIGREISLSGNVRFIKAENIVNNTVVEYPENFIDDDTNEILNRSQLERKDILFVIAGATIGKVAILEENLLPANTNQAISFIRLKESGNVKFIWYWLQSSKIQKLIWLQAVQSAQPNLSMENLGNFTIPFLGAQEQISIVTYIEKECARLGVIIEKFNKQIDLLQEYRTTLISEVVTGKVKVCG